MTISLKKLQSAVRIISRQIDMNNYIVAPLLKSILTCPTPSSYIQVSILGLSRLMVRSRDRYKK